MQKNYLWELLNQKYMNKGMPYIYATLSMLLWSLSYVWYKEVYVFLTPITLIFFRLIVSTLIFVPFLLLTGKMQRMKGKDLGRIFLVALFQPFLYYFGESFGMLYISATLGAVMIAGIPLLAPVAARFFSDERLTKMNMIGIILSFCGVLAVVLSDQIEFSATISGILLMLVAVVSAIAYTIILKPLTENYGAFTLISYQNGIGIIYMLPFFLFFEADKINILEIPFTAYLAVIKLAVFASTLAFVLYTKSLKNLGIAKVNVFANLIPVFTAILAFFILEEAFSLYKLTGITLVIGGLFLSQYVKRNVAGVQ